MPNGDHMIMEAWQPVVKCKQIAEQSNYNHMTIGVVVQHLVMARSAL